MTAVHQEKPRETTEPCWYTPSRVGWWIEHWRLLQELALPTCPAITYDRLSQMPRGLRPADRGAFTDILVDLERARARLKNPSGAQIVADAMATEPLDWDPRLDYLRVVADGLGVRLYDAELAWDEACELVAGWLGWKRR